MHTHAYLCIPVASQVGALSGSLEENVRGLVAEASEHIIPKPKPKPLSLSLSP